MTKTIAVVTVVLLGTVSLAVGQSATARGGTTGAKRPMPTDEHAHASKEEPPEAGRKGVSCQRDIFFKGDDGKMHLCK